MRACVRGMCIANSDFRGRKKLVCRAKPKTVGTKQPHIAVHLVMSLYNCVNNEQGKTKIKTTNNLCENVAATWAAWVFGGKK